MPHHYRTRKFFDCRGLSTQGRNIEQNQRNDDEYTNGHPEEFEYPSVFWVEEHGSV